MSIACKPILVPNVQISRVKTGKMLFTRWPSCP